MNSAFFEYLMTGDKPSLEGLVYFQASFYDKIQTISGPLTRRKNTEYRDIILFATKETLSIAYQMKPVGEFRWNDIVGASVDKLPAGTCKEFPSSDKEIYVLKIHFFGKADTKTGTKRHEFDHDFYSLDHNLVSLWRNLVLQISNNPNCTPSEFKELADIPAFQRNLLIFINPNSGVKRGAQVWKEAEKFLLKSGCTLTEIFTKAAGHAYDYLYNLELSELKKFDGICTISGDGIPHEVINGLFGRPDFEQIKDIPIGALPGGSANALAKNQLSRSGEECDLASACYLVAKGKTIKSDLTVIEGLKDRKVFSFLSFVYGNMARIDIESERFRFLGNMRFYAYGVYAIAKLSTDQGKITFNSNTNKLPPLSEEIQGEGWKEVKDEFSYFSMLNIPFIDGTSKGAPLADFDDGYNHLLYVSGANNTRKHLVDILMKLEGGLFEGDQPAKSTGLKFELLKAFRFEPLTPGYYSVDGEKYEADVVQGHVAEKMLSVYCSK